MKVKKVINRRKKMRKEAGRSNPKRKSNFSTARKSAKLTGKDLSKKGSKLSFLDEARSSPCIIINNK